MYTCIYIYITFNKKNKTREPHPFGAAVRFSWYSDGSRFPAGPFSRSPQARRGLRAARGSPGGTETWGPGTFQKGSQEETTLEYFFGPQLFIEPPILFWFLFLFCFSEILLDHPLWLFFGSGLQMDSNRLLMVRTFLLEGVLWPWACLPMRGSQT